MIEAEWWEYDDAGEMAEAVAGDISFIIESALDARGSSLIALPGGETAKPIFKALAAKKLPWKQVTIIPTDERLVPMDDERSNVRALAQAFLPAGARVIPIAADIPDYRLAGNSPMRGCRTCRGRLTWSGSASERVAARRRCSPAPTCRTRSTHRRRGEPWESCRIHFPTMRR